jgi:RNA:NAD 2'-phosphotransferase (TPT1/KptA family)
MILYHFTKPEFLPAIREQGLVPRAVPHTADNWSAAERENLAQRMTLARPVVWLTTIPDEWMTLPWVASYGAF